MKNNKCQNSQTEWYNVLEKRSCIPVWDMRDLPGQLQSTRVAVPDVGVCLSAFKLIMLHYSKCLPETPCHISNLRLFLNIYLEPRVVILLMKTLPLSGPIHIMTVRVLLRTQPGPPPWGGVQSRLFKTKITWFTVCCHPLFFYGRWKRARCEKFIVILTFFPRFFSFKNLSLKSLL